MELRVERDEVVGRLERDAHELGVHQRCEHRRDLGDRRRVEPGLVRVRVVSAAHLVADRELVFVLHRGAKEEVETTREDERRAVAGARAELAEEDAEREALVARARAEDRVVQQIAHDDLDEDVVTLRFSRAHKYLTMLRKTPVSSQ
ncbi:MAG: hypothetical protein HOV80_06475 [Polyangiaceae bacterium]|nr:hypothetical protein [Polyangiaceae bacterium]